VAFPVLFGSGDAGTSVASMRWPPLRETGTAPCLAHNKNASQC
jgi:hypothetical protein